MSKILNSSVSCVFLALRLPEAVENARQLCSFSSSVSGMCNCKDDWDVRCVCSPPRLLHQSEADYNAGKEKDNGSNEWLENEHHHTFLACPQRIRAFVCMMSNQVVWYQRACRFDFGFVHSLFPPEEAKDVVQEFLRDHRQLVFSDEDLSSVPSSEPSVPAVSSSESEGASVEIKIPTKLRPFLVGVFENWNDIGLLLAQLLNRTRVCAECKQSDLTEEDAPVDYTCKRCSYERKRREERERKELETRESSSDGPSSLGSITSDESGGSN